MNARGVVMARVLGHSWVPIPSTDQTVNVGTLSSVPYAVASSRASCGKARRPLMPVGGGRRVRSSPRAGKPSTWRRDPV